MLPFSPNTSWLWQAAAFSLIYSSIFGLILRLGFLIIMGLTIVLLLTNGSRNLPIFILSMLGTFLMFEAFYKFKILKIKPSKTVEKISSNTNLADLVSFDLTRQFLLHPYWNSVPGLIKVLLPNRKVKFVLNKAGITANDFQSLEKTFEKVETAQLLQLASAFAQKNGAQYVDNLSVLTALFSQSDSLKKILFAKELKEIDLQNIIHWSRTAFREAEEQIPFWKRPTSTLGVGFASAWSGGWTLETERFTTDISTAVFKRRNHFLIGRGKELSQVENVLQRTEKRNVILLGQPGLGKTTIVYSLAAKSITGELPEALRYKRFLELDVTSVMASASEGEVEQRLKDILVEVSHAGDVVLFIPEIENLAGALENGKFNVSGLLSSSLENINLQIIGTSDRAAYRAFIESKPAFSNDFEAIDVSEPTIDEATRILEETALTIEQKHAVVVTYPAIKSVVELSERYIVDEVLPGKAIDLLDETAASKVSQSNKVITKEDVEKVVSDRVKIPVSIAAGEEKEKLLKLSEILHKRVVGQEEAISAITLSVQRARTLKRESTRPNGVFLFLGPTGVGKTETAKALAEVYYGSEDKIVRFDMSSFNQEAAVYRLIGSPPGSPDYKEGGQLTEAVRVNPFSLILLDELEKSHPKVLELFLAIFDEGRITDSSGRPISFTNTIIIGTSNAGAEFIREEIKKATPIETLKTSLTEKLLQDGIFRPEFLNRFDDVIVFRPLGTSEVEKVVMLMVDKLIKRLAKQDLNITVSPEVITYLAQKGYDPQFGARPLQRAIQDQLEGLISKGLLEGKLDRGANAHILVKDNTLQLG